MELVPSFYFQQVCHEYIDRLVNFFFNLDALMKYVHQVLRVFWWSP